MSNQASIVYIFLLPFINLGLWIFFPKKRNGFGIFPTAICLVFWILLLVSGQEDLALNTKENFLFLEGQFDFKIGFSTEERRIFLALLSSFLALLIQVYSLSYMPKIGNWGLYQFLLTLFNLSMNGLFLAGNLFTLLIFWELVGLCSYLLVQFWYENEDPVKAGLKVFLINKLGDLALISGLGLLLSFGLGTMVSHNHSIPAGAEIFFHSSTGSWLIGFLVLASLVKSAQFPFGIWLKEAMQGPTAVSALLHSATMVVAGIWLLIQLSPAFSEEIKLVLLALGGFTFLFFNILALFSYYLKYTLAFSTIAQLGMMVLAIGSGKPEQSLFHLVSHAIFKAGLFLGCGWLMHQAEEGGKKGEESQFIPNLVGLLGQKPIIKWSFIFCLAGLAGWPGTAGFISKELLIPHPNSNSPFLEWFGFFIFQTGIFLTAFYAFRLALFLGFSGPTDNQIKAHSNPGFVLPMAILASLSGFWLMGLNPFSSKGWLADWIQLEGASIFPDVFMLLAGTALAWYFSKNKKWELLSLPSWFKTQILEMGIWAKGISSSWKTLDFIALYSIQAEKKLLEAPLIFLSKTFVVGGYFSAFLDKRVVDGFVNFLAFLVQKIGAMVWGQSKRNPQYVAFFIFFILVACLYFSFL